MVPDQRNRMTGETLMGDSDGPGLAHVYALEPHVIIQKTGEKRLEAVYGVTSVHSERATPGRLLT